MWQNGRGKCRVRPWPAEAPMKSDGPTEGAILRQRRLQKLLHNTEMNALTLSRSSARSEARGLRGERSSVAQA